MSSSAKPIDARDGAKDRAAPWLLFVLIFVLAGIVWVPRALATQGIIDSDLPEMLGLCWTYMPAVAAFLLLG